MDAPRGRNPGQSRCVTLTVQLVSERAPVHDAAAGTVAPPDQTQIETLLSFSALLAH